MIKVIGQEALVEEVSRWNSVPSSIIILGPEHSGRHHFLEYLASRFGLKYLNIGNKIDDIREVIGNSKHLPFPYLFALDSEGMSIGAKNSLLKIMEEAPDNVHIGLVAKHEGSVLDTLLSRSYRLSMRPYTKDDLSAHLVEKHGVEGQNEALRMFETIGQVESMILNKGTRGIGLYQSKIQMFHDNIFSASAGNALKVADWLKLKDKDDREDALDPLLFATYAQNYVGSIIPELLDRNDILQNTKLASLLGELVRELQTKGRSKTIAVNKMLKEASEIGKSI